jgi:hypothetical protein
VCTLQTGVAHLRICQTLTLVGCRLVAAVWSAVAWTQARRRYRNLWNKQRFFDYSTGLFTFPASDCQQLELAPAAMRTRAAS